MRCSLWLMPEPGAALDHVQTLIDATAAAQATPRFTAHVTLLGGLDLDDAAAAAITVDLAAQIPVLDCHLVETGMENDRFRALYWRAEMTDALRAAHARAAAGSGVAAGAYMPHLSVLYGDVPAESRRAIATTMPVPLHLRLDRLALWSTDESNVAGWRRVVELPLRGCELAP